MFDPKAPGGYDSGSNHGHENGRRRGEISSTDVSASFVNGQPSALSVTYIMQSSDEWDRFMRFMDNYAAGNDLGFAGGGGGGGGGSSSGGGGARGQAVAKAGSFFFGCSTTRVHLESGIEGSWLVGAGAFYFGGGGK